MHGWYEPTEFLSVRYYTDFGGGLWWTNETNDRSRAYYGVTGFPTLIMQGTEKIVGGGATIATGEPYRTSYLSHQGLSPIAIEVVDFNPGAGSAEFRLEVVSSPGSISGWQFKSVVYEDDLMDGGEQHDRVARDILPDQAVTVSAVGQTQNFVLSWTTDPSWKVNDLDMVVFVQVEGGLNDKEIIQAQSTIAPPDYAMIASADETSTTAPISNTASLGDIIITNTGLLADSFHATLIPDQVPGDWSAQLTDGTTTHPTTLSATLSPLEEYRFSLEVTPGSADIALWNIEFSQDGNPTVQTIRFAVLTSCLVLVVDGDRGASYETYYTDALAALGYDYAVLDPDAPFADFAGPQTVLIWNHGLDVPTLPESELTALSDYVDRQGNLIIMGQDLGYNSSALAGGATWPSLSWYQNYLMARYAARDSSGPPDPPAAPDVYGIAGIAGDPVTDGMLFDLNGGTSENNQYYLNYVGPAPSEPEATGIFEYVNPNVPIGDPNYRYAGVRRDTGSNRVVYTTFGLEGIADAATRQDLLQRSLDYVGATCAYLSVTACSAIDDSCDLGGVGHQNSEVDPGETVTMELVVENLGTQPETNVRARVTSGTPGVTITQSSSTFGDITPGGSAIGNENIVYSVDATVPCGTNIALDIAIESDTTTMQDGCSISVPIACTPCAAPSLSLSSCDTATDTCSEGGAGHGNSEVDPGESITMSLMVENTSFGPATNVTATVTTTTQGITITQDATSFGDIAGGGSAASASTIDYVVDSSVACPTDISFEVTIESDQGSAPETCGISVPASCVVCEAACSVPQLSVVQDFVASKQDSDLSFGWSPDPNAMEYHVNSVTEAWLLNTSNTNPDTPRLTPTGQGQPHCTAPPAAQPGCVEPSALPGPDTLLFYTVFSACGPSGADEGPW